MSTFFSEIGKLLNYQDLNTPRWSHTSTAMRDLDWQVMGYRKESVAANDQVFDHNSQSDRKRQLVKMREAVGRSQADMAKLLGRSLRDIQGLESLESRDEVSMDVLGEYANVLGHSIKFDLELKS